MSKAYFHKELYSSPYYTNGKVAGFISVGEDEGVLETENDSMIQLLRQAASRHVGGISEIDEITYESKKKLPVTTWVKPLPTLHASEDRNKPPAAMQKAAMDQGGSNLSNPLAAVTGTGGQGKEPRVANIEGLRPKAKKAKDVNQVIEELGI